MNGAAATIQSGFRAGVAQDLTKTLAQEDQLAQAQKQAADQRNASKQLSESEVIHVEFTLSSPMDLGIIFAPGHSPLTIESIVSGYLSASQSYLLPGLQLIELQGQSLLGSTYTDALRRLRVACEKDRVRVLAFEP
jgi:hypothetical protein